MTRIGQVVMLGEKIGQKGKALLNEYSRLVGSKSSKPSEYVEMLQNDIERGKMANFNIFTGERIQYPKSFIKKWNERQKLLTDFTKLVGSETSNPREYAKLLQEELQTGKMANFNVITGEKIQYPKSFVRTFQKYQS